MSRVGRQPVKVPSGVKTSIVDGMITVEGPRGKLMYQLGAGVEVKQDEGVLTFNASRTDKQTVSNYGSARAHVNNMMIGVTKGWKRSLEVNGVGYTAKEAGSVLNLKVGYSHDVNITLPKEVSCQVQKNMIELVSHDKQILGNLAARIRKVRPPEPYLGKGIKYAEEVIKRKAGKTAK
jgi:large subunit ribosomal protein L6